MIVDCQTCDAPISDAAVACPRCGAEKDVFLGAGAGCEECGKPFFPAYRSCSACGAPRAVAIKARKPATNPTAPIPTDIVVDPDAIRAARGQGDRGATARPSIKLKRLGPLQFALRVGLWTYIVVDFVQLAMVGGGYHVLLENLQGRRVSDLELTFMSLVQQWSFAVTVGWMAAFVCCAFLYCVFVFRGLKNLRVMNAPGNETTPLMGALWNFIPIGSLYAPFMVMTELWRVSRRFVGKDARVPIAFWIWWLTWLVSGTAKSASVGLDQTLSQRGGFNADLIPALVQANMISLLCAIVSAFALIGILRGIAVAHDQALAARGNVGDRACE